MKRRTFIGMALAGFASAWTASAGIEDGWKQLGTRTVDLGLDKDVVNCGFSGFIRALCIEVRRSAVQFLEVNVIFGNGEQFRVPLNRVVQAGKRSRVIDLPGSKRVVSRVEFWYRPARGKRAEVVLWGKE